MRSEHRHATRLATVALLASVWMMIATASASAIPPTCPQNETWTPHGCITREPKPRTLGAVIRWQLPPRLHLQTGSRSDVPRESLDIARSAPLILDGCGSPSGSARLRVVGYEWTVTDGVSVWHPSGCHTTLDRPLMSAWTTWTVTLTVTRADGKRATTTIPVRFRDLLIVSLGDSAASGEGAPEKPASKHPKWADEGGSQCDRSARAASAQAAFRIQARYPDTSVTFWHLACSGAAIESGNPDDGGLLTTYHGINHNGATCAPGRSKRCLPPQVDQALDLANHAGRRIDAMLVTAGANDVEWTDIVKDCYTEDAATLLSAVAGSPIIGPLLQALNPCIIEDQRGIAHRLPQLPGRLSDLHERLLVHRNTIEPSHVYLTDYWDPTRDDRGGIYKNVIVGQGYSWFCPREPLAPNSAARRWGHDHILIPMNRYLALAGHDSKGNNVWGWQFVGGIGKLFDGHGLCATPSKSWIVSVLDSINGERSINGSWHANVTGQRKIADKLFGSLGGMIGASGYAVRPEVSVRAPADGSSVACGGVLPDASIFDGSNGVDPSLRRIEIDGAPVAPSTTYPAWVDLAPGHHVIDVAYTNVYHASGAARSTFTVRDPAPPAVTISGVPASVPVGSTVVLDGLATWVRGALAPDQMRWSASDGTVTSGRSFDHVFTQPGTYTVTLTATEPRPCGASASQAATMRVLPASAAPTITITAPRNNDVFLNGDTVPITFTAAVTASDNHPTRIDWADETDGLLGTGQTIQRTLSRGVCGAPHTVTATVTDLVTAQTAHDKIVVFLDEAC